MVTLRGRRVEVTEWVISADLKRLNMPVCLVDDSCGVFNTDI
jgi:hypothetical protein